MTPKLLLYRGLVIAAFGLTAFFVLLVLVVVVPSPIARSDSKGYRGSHGVVVLHSDMDSTVLDIAVADVDFKQISINGNMADHIDVKGSQRYGVPGLPDVPVIRKLIAVPECQSIEIEYDVRSSSEIKEVDIHPHPTIVESGGPDDQVIYEYNESVYSADENFPGGIAKIAQTGYLRDQRLAVVEISPIQFNPVRKQITVLNEIKIKLKTIGPSGETVANVGPMSNVVNNFVANVRETGGSLSSAGNSLQFSSSNSGDIKWCSGSSVSTVINSVAAFGADYLLIVAEELATSAADSSLVNNLAEHRANHNGFNVAIVRMDQIDTSLDVTTSPDSIRAVIKGIYESETAPHMGDGKLGYVLLLGDAWNPEGELLLPTHYAVPEAVSGGEDYPADGYYSFLTDDIPFDPFPDIYIGRLPVDADENDWELDNVIAKITGYEPLPATESWTDSILMVSGGDDDYFSFEGGQGFDDYFDWIIDNAVPSTKTVEKLHRLIGGFTDGEFSATVADTLNHNYWLLGLFDHGTRYYLSGAFYPTDYDTLLNSVHPVVFLIGSNTGWYDLNPDSAAVETVYCLDDPGFGCTDESFTGLACHKPPSEIDPCDSMAGRLVVQENGAIAVFAYSRTDAARNAQSTFYYLFDSVFSGNACTLGEILLGSKMLMSGSFTQAFFTLNLLGDPALNVKWKDVQHDSVDVVIRSSDINGINGTDYVSSIVGNTLQVTVRNIGGKDAYDVSMEIWLGDPSDPTSTRIDSAVIHTVKAYGYATKQCDVGNFDLGFHEIYVKLDPSDEIDEPTEDTNLASTLLAALPNSPGFPVNTHQKTAKAVTISDVADKLGDELLICTEHEMRCYASNDGDLLWSVRRSGMYKTNPLVAHFFKDSTPYVLYEAGTPTYAYFINAETGEVSDSISTSDENLLYPPAGLIHGVGDFKTDNDVLEFVTCRNDSLTAYSAVGSRLWSIQTVGLPRYNRGSAVSVADIDSDGAVEVVAAYRGNLNVLDAETGASGWAGPRSIGIWPHKLVLFDDDDDGDVEILVNGLPANEDHKVYLYDADGDLEWSYTVESEPSFAVGDIDADGNKEIVVAFGNKLQILSSGGVLQDSMSLAEGKFVSTPLLADISGDTEVEIITVTENTAYHEYVPDLGTKSTIGVVRVYDTNLNAVGDTLSFFKPATEDPNPAVADLDSDGDSELVFLSGDRALHVVEIGSGCGEQPWPQAYNNSMNTSLYAQPVVGEYNDPLSLFNRVHVIGDVVLRDDLYVAPGADIRVWKDGVDTFDVYKKVFTEGTEKQPIHIAAWDYQGFSSQKSDWSGINIRNDSTAAGGSFDYCTIRNGVRGIKTKVDMSIKNSTIEQFGIVGVDIARADSVYLYNTTIRGSSPTGIGLSKGSVARVSGCTVEDMTGDGIKVQSAAKLYADGGSVIRDCDVGVYVSIGDSATASADIDSCFILSNDYGMTVYNTSDVSVTKCEFDSNTTDAIYCDGADVGIEQSSIEHSPVGIYCYDHSDATIKINSIKNNSTGIMCDDDSDPLVEDNTITYNGTGVAAINDAFPDLGHSGGGGSASSGLNAIHNNSGFYVANFTEELTIKAEANYWNAKAPPWFPKASRIYGLVDYDPALPFDSASTSSPYAGEERPNDLPSSYRLAQNFPNPFNPTTTIRYDVPAPGGSVSVIVYNVRGQRVATLVNSYKQPGYHRLTWDGANDRGAKVASGVYFVQMRATGYLQTKKLVLLK